MKLNSVWIAVVAMALAGCATNLVSEQRYPLPDGGMAVVHRAGGGFLPEENDFVRIEGAGMGIDREKREVSFGFDATLKGTGKLAHVTVSEVSAQGSTLLVDDHTPIARNGTWSGTSHGFQVGDPFVSWLQSPGTTVKIYEFDLRFADGTDTKIYQGAQFPEVAKNALVQSL